MVDRMIGGEMMEEMFLNECSEKLAEIRRGDNNVAGPDDEIEGEEAVTVVQHLLDNHIRIDQNSVRVLPEQYLDIPNSRCMAQYLVASWRQKDDDTLIIKDLLDHFQVFFNYMILRVIMDVSGVDKRKNWSFTNRIAEFTTDSAVPQRIESLLQYIFLLKSENKPLIEGPMAVVEVITMIVSMQAPSCIRNKFMGEPCHFYEVNPDSEEHQEESHCNPDRDDISEFLSLPVVIENKVVDRIECRDSQSQRNYIQDETEGLRLLLSRDEALMIAREVVDDILVYPGLSSVCPYRFRPMRRPVCNLYFTKEQIADIVTRDIVKYLLDCFYTMSDNLDNSMISVEPQLSSKVKLSDLQFDDPKLSLLAYHFEHILQLPVSVFTKDMSTLAAMQQLSTDIVNHYTSSS